MKQSVSMKVMIDDGGGYFICCDDDDDDDDETTRREKMNAIDKYNEIALGWKRHGNTAEANHGLMHLEDVWYRCHYRDGADLEQAYEQEVRNCAACKTTR